MKLRSDCHPEARGRKPKHGEIAWTLRLMLENGEPLELEIGQKGRDILFGMMIADCHDFRGRRTGKLSVSWVRKVGVGVWEAGR